MKAAIWWGPDRPDQTIEEIEPRTLGSGEVRVRILAANACVTDVIDSKPRAVAADLGRPGRPGAGL